MSIVSVGVQGAPPHGAVRVAPVHVPAIVEPGVGCVVGGVGRVLVCAVCLVMGAASGGVCSGPVPGVLWGGLCGELGRAGCPGACAAPACWSPLGFVRPCVPEFLLGELHKHGIVV